MKKVKVVYVTNELPGRPFTDVVEVPDNYTDADIKESLHAMFIDNGIAINGKALTVHHITLVVEVQ